MALEPAGLTWLNQNLPEFLSGIDKANKGIADVGKQSVAAVSGTSKLDAQSGKTTKSFLDFSKAADLVKKAVVGYVAALGVREVVQFGQESLVAYQRLAAGKGALMATVGSTEAYNEVISKAREATHGMVSEAELAASANVLLASHLADSSDEAAQLINAGSILTGVFSASGATIEKFGRLLSSGNQVLFDNFGLTMDMVQAKQRDIEATSDLTGQEARLAAIRALLLESAEKYESAVSESEQSTRQWQAAVEDLKASIGEALVPAATTLAKGATEVVRSGLSVKDMLNEEYEAIYKTSDSFEIYAERLNEVGLALDMSREQFEANKTAARALAVDVGDLTKEERMLAAAVTESAQAEGLSAAERAVVGQHRIEYWQAIEDAARETMEEERKANEEAVKAARETAQSLLETTASYFLNLRGMQDEAAGSQREFEASMGEARASAAEQQTTAQESLSTKLEELAQQREEKLHWVLTGAHARTQEENDRDLAYWNAHFDQLEAEARNSYAQQNADIQAKLGEREANLAAARAKEAADQQAALDHMRVVAALTILEQSKQLEAFTGGMATSAKDAVDLIEAGVLPLTRNMALELQNLMGDMAASNEQATERAGANSALLSQALAGDLEGTARPAVQNLGLDLQNVADATLPGLQTAGTTATTALTAGLETGVRTSVQGLDLDMQNVTMLTLPTLQETALTTTTAMTTAVQTVTTAVQTLVTQITNLYTATLPTLQSVTTSTTTNMSAAVQTVTDALNGTKTAADEATGAMTEGFQKAKDKVTGKLIPALDSLVTWLEKVKSAAEDAAAATRGLGGAAGGAGAPGFQRGADFIVPQGYPHDTFPLRVSSGERVIVVPQGAASAPASAQTIFNLNVSTRATAQAVIGEFEIMRALVS